MNIKDTILVVRKSLRSSQCIYMYMCNEGQSKELVIFILYTLIFDSTIIKYIINFIDDVMDRNASVV